ncbi:Uma2 family endonuclease [Streptomyces sp. NPDC052396]|uniref:Uma2 family endonuclease n=1 Tax=Streptomyces sp. NPDC052396 TaxID=3365689 RepID=UPI0037CD45BA
MTAVDDRLTSDVSEFFANLEVPEGYRAELLRGEIVMMAAPDWVHNDIVERIAEQIPFSRWQRKQTQDIAIPGEASEPVPDLVVVEREAFDGPGLVPAEVISFLLEVVSKTSATRDYRVKRSVYAAGRVPAYLIVDPFAATCMLLTEPVGAGEDADYANQHVSKFGDPVQIEALELALDTSEFRTIPGKPLY